MKKHVILAAIVVAIALVLVVAASPQLRIQLTGGVFDSERGHLEALTVDFLEDIKYKDFPKASTYHLKETQEARDIPELIRRIFGVKHEQLDIHHYRILGTDFDRARTRARVRTQIRFRIIGDSKIMERPDSQRTVELIFYWFRQPDGSWTMELESSLR